MKQFLDIHVVTPEGSRMLKEGITRPAQVSGQNLLPFTFDKQALLLDAIMTSSRSDAPLTIEQVACDLMCGTADTDVDVCLVLSFPSLWPLLPQGGKCADRPQQRVKLASCRDCQERNTPAAADACGQVLN
jgi:hypothetical protein